MERDGPAVNALAGLIALACMQWISALIRLVVWIVRWCYKRYKDRSVHHAQGGATTSPGAQEGNKGDVVIDLNIAEPVAAAQISQGRAGPQAAA
jgi:hypothetical protein